MMKKINFKIFLLAITILGFTACGERDEIIYEGTQSDQALISFDKETYNLEVERDNEGSLEVLVTSSATRDTDRTYNVTIVEGETNTTADPSTYDIPETVTIPAGEYSGSLIIDGFDNGVETSPEIITIKLEGIEEDSSTSFTTAVISIYEVCPIPEDFLIGQYEIEDVEATIGPANDTENFYNSTVNITEGETPTSRTFTVTVIGGSSVQVTLSLICGEIVLQDVDPGIGCSEAAYIFTRANSGTIYDPNGSDDEFIIIYTEDPNGSCGGPFQSSFKLTKIEQ